MKRQRGGNVNPPKVEKEVAPIAMVKKKAKKDVEQKNVVIKSIVDQKEKEEEERKEIKGEVEQVAVAGDIGNNNNNNNDNVMGWNNFEEYMPWLGGVDEQMSWGTTWFPWWDMDFINGDAFSSLYNDVVWDDDIWNHNKEIPNFQSL